MNTAFDEKTMVLRVYVSADEQCLMRLAQCQRGNADGLKLMTDIARQSLINAARFGECTTEIHVDTQPIRECAVVNDMLMPPVYPEKKAPTETVF